jgi:hypothetical protein
LPSLDPAITKRIGIAWVGTVNLKNFGDLYAARSDFMWFEGCDVAPCLPGVGSQFATMVKWNVVSGNVNQVCDWIVDGGETLKVAC